MLDWSFSPALVWAVVGLVLLIAELATVSFILCFIGLGALIVALTTWLSITPSFSSQAEAIRAIASATADGLKAVAGAVQTEGGMEAVQLRVAEKLVEQFGHLAKQGNTLILPANFGDISSLIATAMSVVKQTK
jgi:membrane protein implicated in regulation of membrane protease activity